jgi:tripartite-type tricarboxylate transporter receptor subunit TctC
MFRREFLSGSLALAAASAAGPVHAGAEANWPSRPVRIVYPYSAGSIGDATARLLAQRFSEVFHQPFFVENRLGANGTIAAEAVAHAAPDGHTLFYALTPQIAISPAISKQRYDPIADFVPISTINTSPFALIVHPSLPVTTVEQFIEYVGVRPDQLAFAEGGVGSINQLAMILFLRRAGIQMIDVGYKGNALALTDVVSGHVAAMFSLFGDALQQTKSGMVRMLAVTSERRLSKAPNVPSLAESGFSGFRAESWHGLMAPAHTPQKIVDRIADEVVRVVRDKGFAERLMEFGLDPVGNTPREFADLIAADMQMWAEAVRVAKLTGP